MNTDSRYRRLFALLSLALFVAGLLVPFAIAAIGQSQLAIGFGVVSEILALLFGLLGLPYAPARVAVICNTLLLAGAGIVAAVQWQQGRYAEVVAWLSLEPDTATVGDNGNATAAYEEFRVKQSQLLTSREVLTAAMQREGIADLDVIRTQADPIDWLSHHINVVAPVDSTVLQLRLRVMRGKHAVEAAQLVNAIAYAYLEQASNEKALPASPVSEINLLELAAPPPQN